MKTSVLSRKKGVLTIIAASLLAAALLSACGAGPAASTPSGTVSGTTAATPTAAPTSPPQSSGRVLTKEELATYNGQNGQPAYIAIGGVVYDVTNIPPWNGGLHNGFEAGQDLTDALKTKAPHGLSVLTGVPVAGSLK